MLPQSHLMNYLVIKNHHQAGQSVLLNQSDSRAQVKRKELISALLNYITM